MHPGVACGQAELDILFRREINDDQPVDAGVHGVGKEAIDAVDVDWVVVAHENDRSLVVSGPEATNHVERAVEARAARLSPQARGLDGWAVGHGIGIHDAQLDQVGTGIRQAFQDLEAGLEVRVGGHDEWDEGRAALAGELGAADHVPAADDDGWNVERDDPVHVRYRNRLKRGNEPGSGIVRRYRRLGAAAEDTVEIDLFRPSADFKALLPGIGKLRRSVQAEQGIQKLKEKVDTLIVIPNDRLLSISTNDTSMLNAFKMADEILLQGVQGITDLITTPGLINTDFADVRTVMVDAGSALMGIGHGSGEGRAIAAARAAISSPLLEASIENARGILLNICGGPDLGLLEVNEAAEIIHGVAHQDANIIFGTVIDDEMGDDVRVTVIAAGFDRWDESIARTGQAPAREPMLESGDPTGEVPIVDVFATDDEGDLDLGDPDFDVPSFLK